MKLHYHDRFFSCIAQAYPETKFRSWFLLSKRTKFLNRFLVHGTNSCNQNAPTVGFKADNIYERIIRPSNDDNFALSSPPGRAQRAGTAEVWSQSILLGNGHASCHPRKKKKRERSKKSLFAMYLSLSQKKALAFAILIIKRQKKIDWNEFVCMKHYHVATKTES